MNKYCKLNMHGYPHVDNSGIAQIYMYMLHRKYFITVLKHTHALHALTRSHSSYWAFGKLVWALKTRGGGEEGCSIIIL